MEKTGNYRLRSEVWGGKGDTYQRDMLSEELGERPAHYKLMTEIEYPPAVSWDTTSMWEPARSIISLRVTQSITITARRLRCMPEIRRSARMEAGTPSKMSAISPCGFWRRSSTPDDTKRECRQQKTKRQGSSYILPPCFFVFSESRTI